MPNFTVYDFVCVFARVHLCEDNPGNDLGWFGYARSTRVPGKVGGGEKSRLCWRRRRRVVGTPPSVLQVDTPHIAEGETFLLRHVDQLHIESRDLHRRPPQTAHCISQKLESNVAYRDKV